MQVGVASDILPNDIKNNKGKKTEQNNGICFESLMLKLSEMDDNSTTDHDLNLNTNQNQEQCVEEEKIDESLIILNQPLFIESNDTLKGLQLSDNQEFNKIVNLSHTQYDKKKNTEILTVSLDEFKELEIDLKDIPQEKIQSKNLLMMNSSVLFHEENIELSRKKPETLMTFSSFQRQATLKEKIDESTLNSVGIQSVISQEGSIENQTSQSIEPNIKWENQVEIEQEIFKSVSVLKENESSRLVLKLFPRELGSLHIELQLKDGILSGLIQVEQSKTAELLQHVGNELNQILQNVEIKLAEGGIDNQQQFLNQQFQHSNSRQNESQQNKNMIEVMTKELESDAEEIDELVQERHQINLTV